MARTSKGSKPPGYDYWSRRPGNESYCNSPGDGVKKRTHRLERIKEKREIEKQRSDQ